MLLPLLPLTFKVPLAPQNAALPVVSRVESAALLKALPTLPPGFRPLDSGLLGALVPAPKGPAPLTPAAAAAVLPPAAEAPAKDLQGAFSLGARLFDGRIVTTPGELEPAQTPVPAR